MKHILELIENVDPSDNKALDEIDARVWYWIRGLTLEDYQAKRESFAPKYTRSRDALKAIRPKGWFFHITNEYKRASCLALGGELVGTRVLGDHLLTEELAELHAILQAIEYERGQE